MLNDKDIKHTLGTSLKEFRAKKKISQEKLAEFLGVTTQTIARIELGQRFVSSEFLAKLCNYFQVEPYEFFLSKGQTYTPKSLDYIEKIDKNMQEILKVVKTLRK